MKVLLLVGTLALALNSFAHNHKTNKKKAKGAGHDKEHSHVKEAADHSHDEAHHGDHDHKAHHPEHDDKPMPAAKNVKKKK